MTRIVTMTGGLDTTWVMQKLLNIPDDQPAEEIIPVYLNFNQGSRAGFVEYLLGTESTLRLMNASRWYQRSMRWALSARTYNHIRGSRIGRLVQQGNVVLMLANVVNETLNNGQGVTAYTGWNKGDCIENNYARAEYSLEDYDRLKRMYQDLVYFQDHGYRVAPLMTPAWDMAKFDMWRDLPENVRTLITVASTIALEIIPCPEIGYFYIVVKTDECAKFVRYKEAGMHISAAWRVCMNKAYYDRIQTSTLPTNDYYPYVPHELLKIPDEFKRPHEPCALVLDDKTEPLLVKAFSHADWLDYYPKLEEYLRDRDEKAKTSSETVDDSTVKMAASKG